MLNNIKKIKIGITLLSMVACVVSVRGAQVSLDARKAALRERIAALDAGYIAEVGAICAEIDARLAGAGAAAVAAPVAMAPHAAAPVAHDAEARREPVGRFSTIRSWLGALAAAYVAVRSAQGPLIDTSTQRAVSGSVAGAVMEVPGVLQSSSVSDLYEPTGAGSGGSVPSCIFGDGLAHSAVAQEAMLSNVSSAPVFYGNRENERALDLGFLLRGGPRLPFAVTLAPSEDRSRALVLYSAPTKASDEKAHK